jgi:COP9 signalosome complex subunit 1
MHNETSSSFVNQNIDFSGEENENEMDNSYGSDFEINNSSIDLDLYTSGYVGYMRIARLLFLAEHCPPLKIDALKLALSFVVETYNTNLYTIIHKQLSETFHRQQFSLPCSFFNLSLNLFF